MRSLYYGGAPCLILITTLLLTWFSVCHGQVFCPAEWENKEDSCYKTYQMNKIRSEANETCESEGAHLLSIGDQGEQSYLEMNYNDGHADTWIGLHREVTNGVWQWDDGTNYSFNNWHPTGNTDGDLCAFIALGSHKKWKTSACSDQKHFICEKPANGTGRSGSEEAEPNTNDELQDQVPSNITVDVAVDELMNLERIVSNSSVLSDQQYTQALSKFNDVIVANVMSNITRRNDTLRFITATVDTGSALLNPNLHDKNQSVANAVVSMAMAFDIFGESIATHLVATGQDYIEKSSANVEFRAKLLTSTSDDSDRQTTVGTSSSGASVTISHELIGKSGILGVVTVLYHTLHDILPGAMNYSTPDNDEDGTDSWNEVKLASQVYCVTMNPKPPEPFSSPMKITLTTHQSVSSLRCGYLVQNTAGNSEWRSDGCELSEITAHSAVCECYHTTNFAVLMQITDIQIDAVHEVALSVISKTGCSISLVCLILTFVGTMCLKLRSDRVIILVNLLGALFGVQMLFLFGIQANRYLGVCKCMAIALHYFCLAAFTWMLVEGIQLYRKVRTVFLGSRSTMVYYCVLGWGVPVIIVTISAAVKFENYGSGKVCWLSPKDGTIYAFVGPALCVVLVNIVVLIFVLKAFMTVKVNAKKTEVQKIRAGIRASLVLVPLLGLTWVFGILAVNEDTIIFQYVFALVNSLQGFFIFLFHCVLNEEVKVAFRKRYGKETGSSSSSSSGSGSAPSTAWTDSSKGPHKSHKITSLSDMKVKLISKSTSSVGPVEVKKEDVKAPDSRC